MFPCCGGGEIRTRGPLSRPSVFKTDGLIHSPTPPLLGIQSYQITSLQIYIFSYKKANILSPFFLFICSRKYIAGRNRIRNFATLLIGLWLERRRWWALLSFFMVGIVGIEPTTYRIWICCSTTELYPNLTGSKRSEY